MASDLVRVDQNLQVIRQIEGAWSLPQLPDQVKLDLAGNTIMNPAALQGLLGGVEEQLQEANRRLPLPTRDTVGAGDVLPAKPMVEPEGKVAVGRIIAGITGQDRPQVLDPLAVRRLKQALASEGYLELNQAEIDSDRWLPEYSYAAAQRSFDMMSREFQGEKPGSLSVENILNIVDEWLSPRGLYRAAVELDLMWDFAEIGEEGADWGNKWRRWREDPLNPRLLVDALSGPLDDVIFPILNVGLMFTGIGEILGVSRIALGGLKGAQKVAGLYRGTKRFRFMDEAAMAADVARFQAPSFLSGQLAARGGAPGRLAARGMDQWRKFSAVTVAKKVNQQALKLGFTHKLEELVDADRGGQGISHLLTQDQLSEQINRTFSNPLLDWGVDLLLFPPSIYAPGRFSRPAADVLERVRKGFVDLSDNRDLMIAWHDPVRAWLRESEGAEVAQAFDKAVQDSGMKEALKAYVFGGDDETMGTAMGFVTVMAAVDGDARRTASIMRGDPLNALDSKTRELFHQARNQIRGRLRILDPNDVEDLVTHFAKYGTEHLDGSLGPAFSRSTVKFNEQRAKLINNLSETAEEAAARAGAIPEGHVRFVGDFDVETGRYVWRPLTLERLTEGSAEAIKFDDPYFVDIAESDLRAVAKDDFDAVLRGDVPLPEQLTRRYMKRDGKVGIRHYRLSEAGKMRLMRPEKVAELRALADRHNELRAAELARLMEDLSPEQLSAYIYEVLPTFGDWNKFVNATAEIRHSLMRGDLDNVRYMTPLSETGRRLSAVPDIPESFSVDGQGKWVNEMFTMMVEFTDKSDWGPIMKSVFSPLARDVDPVLGSFTVARLDSATKQDALAFYATVKHNLNLLENLRKIKKRPVMHEVWSRINEARSEGVTLSLDVVRQYMSEVLGHANDKNASLLRRLATEAKDAGTSLDDIERTLMRRLQEFDVRPDWSESFHVPTGFGDELGDVVTKLKAKLKELRRQANFMASAVEGAPTELTEHLARHGYRLVHGVDFHQPFDLDGILPEFADATRRQVQRARMGQFFERQDPDYVSKLKARKVRDALHARLSQVSSDDGVRLNLGSTPDPGNADLNDVMRDLWEILDQVHDDARHILDNMADARFFEKFFGRAHLARIPFSIDRLGSDLGYKKLVSMLMDKGYSREQSRAIYQALQSAQALGYRTHGLLAIETKLRSEPNLIEGLRALGTIRAGDQFRGLRRVGGHRPIRGALAAAGGGYAADAYAQDAGLSDWERRAAVAGSTIVGGLVGRSRFGIPGVARFADRLENSDFLRYAYLADHLANFRDYVRFSLSPIFDASRYSEAIILGQIGHLPEGVRNLRVNQSPTTFRRMLAKEFRQQGFDKDVARQMAKTEWGRLQEEFAAAARGYRDFEWEAIDGVARRFSSVGILGFSPVDWMASTYGHLRRAGVDMGTAYDTVRQIYTYGTTGRSAAELSMNFVFFPFSFTKKVVGHLNKFFTDDLTRLVVLQDMMATYQIVSDHFNLSQEWKDRLPILQRAHRLNLLAYGIGLGRFGGVNAPMIEAIGRLPFIEDVMETLPGPPEVVNAFIPQMVTLSNEEDANDLWDLTKQMIPVMHDVQTMMIALGEQGRVAFSETHMTARAESKRAWEEWREFQADIETVLQEMGMTWAQAVRRPELNEFIQQKRVEISRKYPAWKEHMADQIGHARARDMEKQERIRDPQSPADLLLVEFEALLDEAKAAASRAGMGSLEDSPEMIDPEFFRLLRSAAAEFVRQDPEFLRLYMRFYRRLLGDIVSDV